MGVRNDKGRAVTRYLTGSTGIPMLSWNADNNTISAPPPYKITLTTSRKLENWHDILRREQTGGLHVAIRYDNSQPAVDHAWVGLSLKDFTVLLTAHYESIRDRVQQYTEGE
jgi:hypothetical protein